jgi:hypothetical protein
VCQKLGLDVNQVELSMGMSDDFEHAVRFLAEVALILYIYFNVFYRLKSEAPM